MYMINSALLACFPFGDGPASLDSVRDNKRVRRPLSQTSVSKKKVAQKEGQGRSFSQIEQANGTPLQKRSQINLFLRVLFCQGKKNASQIGPYLEQKPICEKPHQ
jgi:hypothetical protein